MTTNVTVLVRYGTVEVSIEEYKAGPDGVMAWIPLEVQTVGTQQISEEKLLYNRRRIVIAEPGGGK